MKFNKWTLGLAALGVVSLASAARADEKMSQVQTALSNTTLSGYVDTSVQWNPGTGNSYVAPVAFQNSSKADGFNLNVVDLALDKPMDEGPWAAGYHVELWMGPDANSLGTLSNPYLNPYAGSGNGTQFPGPGPSWYDGNLGGSDFAIRQAYVAVRTPVGNTGIDWKLGVFDSPLGYESTSSPSNPFYTRSYGYSIEPTELTGLMGTFKVNDMLSVTAGIANTAMSMINERAFITYEQQAAGYSNFPAKAESYKTYFGAVTFTAPDTWGWASGSTLTAGVLNGYNNVGLGGTQTSWYLGGTLATPVKGLKVGAAWDYENFASMGTGSDFYQWTFALYGSYQANDKLSFNARVDYWKNWYGNYNGPLNDNLWSATADVQYNLWQNVIARAEVRWDHAEHSQPFGGNNPFYESRAYAYSSWDSTTSNKNNAFMLALQLIYQF